MCEVLAVNANTEVPVMLAWRAFRHRGKYNADGWGLAYLNNGGFEVKRFITSLAEDVRGTDAPSRVRTTHFLGHVRYRVQGKRSKENTQPFLDAQQRYAIAATMSSCRVTTRFRQEVQDRLKGDTGPEILFAILCEEDVAEVIERVFLEESLGRRARASFVLSDGEAQYAFAYNRPLYYLTRKPPHSSSVRLKDPAQPSFEAELSVEKGTNEVATIIASTPLTDEDWTEMSHREFAIIRGGEVEATRQL